MLTGLVIIAQLAPIPALVELTPGRAVPGSRYLVYPLLHVVLAPFTLLADWLNGGSRQDIIGFVLWSAVCYALARMAWRARGAWREAFYAVGFVALLGGFIAWVAYGWRPIPRLATRQPDELVWDAHSHTAASHDGRRGFTAARNAAWHAEAGFGAAFITDHNLFTAPVAGRGARLLPGEELSLSGIHLLVLGTRRQIANEPMNHDWDSTLTLIGDLAAASRAGDGTFLVASLPEYWRHHWGADLRDLAVAGVMGFEVWTSSPKGMEIPPRDRDHVLARSRVSRMPVLGATDMHGLGRTASVWNVMRLPGWRELDDDTLAAAVIGRLRSGYGANEVVAMARWLPRSAVGRAVAVPVNVVLLAGRGSLFHGAALVGWIWLGAFFLSRGSRPRTP